MRAHAVEKGTQHSGSFRTFGDPDLSGRYHGTTTSVTEIPRPDVDAYYDMIHRRNRAEIHGKAEDWLSWAHANLLQTTTLMPGERLLKLLTTDKSDWDKPHELSLTVAGRSFSWVVSGR